MEPLASNEYGAGLCNAIKLYLSRSPCSVDYEFPLGGQRPIPAAEELALVEELLNLGDRISPHELTVLRERLTTVEAYDLAIFSFRMAVQAVRTGSPESLEAALVGLVIDDDLIDWRDILVGLSIVEDCARRLGLNARMVLGRARGLAAEGRRETIDGYFRRTDSMRSLSVMGIEVSGSGSEITYVKRTWT